MKKLNLYFGLLLFVVFLLTGQYMQHVFRPQYEEQLVLRMQVRANHIYILFISLLNILAFKCSLSGNWRYKSLGMVIFHASLVASGILMVMAFFTEYTTDMSNRTLTKYSAILAILSIGILLASELVHLRKIRR